jgi:hypothetical protein
VTEKKSIISSSPGHADGGVANVGVDDDVRDDGDGDGVDGGAHHLERKENHHDDSQRRGKNG